jgi:hypothetical protein
MNFTTIPIIVSACYLVITALKATKLKNNWFPLISCGLGAIIGAGMFYIFPEFLDVENIVNAVISGGASGLAATGTNQIIKQYEKAKAGGTKKSNNRAD